MSVEQTEKKSNTNNVNEELVYIGVKIDRRLKELFVKLAEEEQTDISQALRELIIEALSRGYINRTRREMVERLRQI